MKILVTGAAGFIGFHLSSALLSRNHIVIGIDNLNNYYDPLLKKQRLDELSKHSKHFNFKFLKKDIADRPYVKKLFTEHSFDIVINLAAQAGVRYSIDNPDVYIDSNIVGFLNILEGCRQSRVKHLIYASSSSVYGMNLNKPFNVDDRTDYPASLYAATKKSNELMAHTYSHLYDIPSTGLRFFTVYGPYGRPDMAYYKFTKAILNGDAIDVYNNGNLKRDFTYIDDIIDGILLVMSSPPKEQTNIYSSASPPHQLFNIGNNNPVALKDFIRAIEKACGKEAIKNNLPMQLGDVPETFADIDPLITNFGFKPRTSINKGILNFVTWYRKNVVINTES